jgi:cytochrome c
MQALGLWRQQLMRSTSSMLLMTAVIIAPSLFAADSPPDIEHGKATFNTMCGVCHSVQKTGGPVEGPNLIGVVGRNAGSQPDFAKYSEALKASGLTWSTDLLDTFLTNPMALVPGTLMPMLIPDDKTRADVVAYLASLKAQ